MSQSDALSEQLQAQLSSLPASPRLAETLHLFLEGQPAEAAGQEPWEIFLPWVTEHEPSAVSERLQSLNDNQPVPASPEIKPDPGEEAWLQTHSAADRRSIKVFQELIKQQRKSSKYLHELRQVFERNPDQRLARMLLSYLLRWESPDAADEFASHQLGQHPDWLLLRAAWANQVMFRTNPRQPEPDQLAQFLQILNQELELEKHLGPDQPAEAETALLFYQAIGFYYLLQRQLERAVYAINQAARLDPQNPMLMMLLMTFTAIAVEDPGRAKALRDFLHPLMAVK